MVESMASGSSSVITPVEHAVLALERVALAKWCRGDPSGFLEICDEQVDYFDPFRPARIDGLAALTAYYETLRGQVTAVAWQILEPRVVELADAAILSYRFRCWGATGTVAAWNCTEVFRRHPEGWRILHTHWSFTAVEADA
jgi:hypothetical protein